MPTYSDTFSGSGALGNLEVGDFPWVAKRGAWTCSGGKAVCSDAPNTNPLVVADFGTGDIDAYIDIYNGYAGGDALYFRVSDADNWWRVRNRYYYTTYTYQSGTQMVPDGPPIEQGIELAGDWYVTVLNQPLTPGLAAYGVGTFVLQSVALWTAEIVAVDKFNSNGINYTRWNRDTKPHYYQPYKSEPIYSTGYNYYYQIYLDKCVAGTISNVKASSAYSMFGSPRLRVVTEGPSITFYWYSGATLQSSLNVSDSFNQGATMHGIGKGGNDSNSYSSGLDNFSLTTAGSSFYVPAILL